MADLQSKDLSFKVLSLLSRERGVYGLRNGDYERYRHHCANKIHRLRQVTGNTSGKGKMYKNPIPTTPESIKDIRQLQLVLFNAERALAHSHQFKSLSTKTTSPPHCRRDQLSWLRRALKHSSYLYELVTALKTRVPARTTAEVAIYHLSIRAELAFERKSYDESLIDLAIRRSLLSILSNSSDSYDAAVAQEYMDQFDPLIRFSAHRLGRGESHDIDGVVADVDGEMMEETLPGYSTVANSLRGEIGAVDMEGARKDLQGIVWAGEPIQIRNGDLVKVMAKVQIEMAKLQATSGSGSGSESGSKSMRGWDRVLSVLGEAEAVARRLVDEDTTTTSFGGQNTGLALAHQYVIYLLLSHRIRRDLLLVDTLKSTNPVPPPGSGNEPFRIPRGRIGLEEAVKSLAGVIKLYSTVIQSLGQVRGVSAVEEREGVRAGVEALEGFYGATRCYHLAHLHAIHPSPSYAKSISLLELASSRLSAIGPLLSAPFDEPIVPLTTTVIVDLQSRIDALSLAAKRSMFAQVEEKPIFFDMAFNYIDLPMRELLVRAGKELPPPIPQKPQNEAMDVDEPPVVKIPKPRQRSREATPAGEDGKPKGWLGGWFGR